MSTRAFGRETKFQKVRVELESLANRLGPMQKLPSIRELSTTMGASVSTLTGALDELESQNLVYRRHGVGIFVSPARTRAVWLLCDSRYFSQDHSPFWDVLASHAQTRAQRNNETLSMHFTLPQGRPDATLHHTLVEEIRAGRVHGIIGIGLNRSVAKWIIEQGVPLTAFAGWAPYVVSLDMPEFVRKGITALTDQGCKRIGLLHAVEPAKADEMPVPDSADPAVIFARYLEVQGQSVLPELIKASAHRLESNDEEYSSGESYPEQGYRATQEIFGSSRELWPDGLVVTDDTMMQGALLAMARLGIRPGHDVRIVSHANKGTNVLLGEMDNTIRLEFDPVQVVKELFDVLETLMDGRTPGNVSRHFFDAQARLVQPSVVMPESYAVRPFVQEDARTTS